MAVAVKEMTDGRTPLPFSVVEQTIPAPETITDAQRAYYSSFYETNTSDTTPESRSSIIKRLNSAIPGMRRGGVILDLGSGRQPLEAEHTSEFGVPGIVYSETGAYVHAYNFLTVDHATLDDDQLLARNAPHVTHRQASGDKLDLVADESIDIAISNLALDFMPREAVAELYRVLVPGGKVILNLSDPRSVIPRNLDEKFADMNHKMYGNRWKRKRPQKAADRQTLLMLRNKRMLRDTKSLFETEEQIREEFGAYGFSLLNVTNQTQEASDGGKMGWWEVDLQKPTEHDFALQTFSKNLEQALGFDENDFATSAKSLYFKYLRQSTVAARQNIAARAVASWNPEGEEPYKPDPAILLEGSTRFAAKGAKAVGRGSENWFLQIAMGLVSAERPVTENGVLKLLPIASDGRVHGNRNTRDQVIMLYRKLLLE